MHLCVVLLAEMLLGLTEKLGRHSIKNEE